MKVHLGCFRAGVAIITLAGIYPSTMPAAIYRQNGDGFGNNAGVSVNLNGYESPSDGNNPSLPYSRMAIDVGLDFLVCPGKEIIVIRNRLGSFRLQVAVLEKNNSACKNREPAIVVANKKHFHNGLTYELLKIVGFVFRQRPCDISDCGENGEQKSISALLEVTGASTRRVAEGEKVKGWNAILVHSRHGEHTIIGDDVNLAPQVSRTTLMPRHGIGGYNDPVMHGVSYGNHGRGSGGYITGKECDEQPRYMRRNDEAWIAMTTRGEDISNHDIDVSYNGRQWFHLLGDYCLKASPDFMKQVILPCSTRGR